MIRRAALHSPAGPIAGRRPERADLVRLRHDDGQHVDEHQRQPEHIDQHLDEHEHQRQPEYQFWYDDEYQSDHPRPPPTSTRTSILAR